MNSSKSRPTSAPATFPASCISAAVPTFVAQAFFALTSLGLIVLTARFGTYQDSARVGLALGLLAPVHLLLGMQHNTVLLVKGAPYDEVLGARFLLSVPFAL